MNQKTVLSIFKITLPVFFGYISCGIAYGLVLTNAGYSWWFAPLSCLFMYAGAGQFIAIGLFAAGTALPAIIITEALVNIRHIVYGLSLITKFHDCGKWKPYLIYALTDETYSLLTTVEVPQNINKGNFYGLISIFDQSYWVLGSTIGALVGQYIPFDMTGVDFALTALFAVLTVEQIRKTKELLPILIGAVCTILSIILWRFGIIPDSSNILMIALSIGIPALLICKYRPGKTDNSNGGK